MTKATDALREAAEWSRQAVQSPDHAVSVINEIEELTARILMNQSHSVEAYSSAGDAIFVNPAWQQLWGMEPREMQTYNMLHDENLHGKVTWESISKGFQGIAGPTPEACFSPEEIGMPGRERWTDGFIAPVMDSSERVARITLMLRDVSDMKFAMGEIKLLQDGLQTLQSQHEALTQRLEQLADKDKSNASIHRLARLPEKTELMTRAASLSRREKQIFKLLAADKSVKEIAFDLNLGSKSVYTYRSRLMYKLGLQTDVQAAAAYMELAEIAPEQL